MKKLVILAVIVLSLISFGCTQQTAPIGSQPDKAQNAAISLLSFEEKMKLFSKNVTNLDFNFEYKNNGGFETFSANNSKDNLTYQFFVTQNPYKPRFSSNQFQLIWNKKLIAVQIFPTLFSASIICGNIVYGFNIFSAWPEQTQVVSEVRYRSLDQLTSADFCPNYNLTDQLSPFMTND